MRLMSLRRCVSSATRKHAPAGSWSRTASVKCTLSSRCSTWYPGRSVQIRRSSSRSIRVLPTPPAPDRIATCSLVSVDNRDPGLRRSCRCTLGPAPSRRRYEVHRDTGRLKRPISTLSRPTHEVAPWRLFVVATSVRSAASPGAGVMNPARFFVVLGTGAAQWAARYNIEPFSVPCDLCGAEQSTTQPFAYQSFRGLVAPKCQCGSDSTPYCVVAAPGARDLLTGREARGPRTQASKRTSRSARHA
jgi:hypothetical protein